MKISNEVVASLRKWLGPEGLGFFRACKKHHGRVDPVFMVWDEADAKMDDAAVKRMAEPDRGPERHLGNAFGLGKNYPRPLPHPVHFREGMQVRNHLRTLDPCQNWSSHELDNCWTAVVERAIAQEEG